MVKAIWTGKVLIAIAVAFGGAQTAGQTDVDQRCAVGEFVFFVDLEVTIGRLIRGEAVF